MRVLGFWELRWLLVAWPAYADQSDPVQAVPVQPDGAALMQKIPDLEDRARRGRFAGLKTEASSTQATCDHRRAQFAELGTQAAGSLRQAQPPSPRAVAKGAGAQTIVLGRPGTAPQTWR
jgi:hypothetical protein